MLAQRFQNAQVMAIELDNNLANNQLKTFKTRHGVHDYL